MLNAFTYLIMKNGVLDKVLCKICGTTIAEVREGENTLHRYKNRFAEAELELRPPDGHKLTSNGRHITCLCRSCVILHGDDRALLQEAYDADVETMVLEEPRMGVYRGLEVRRLRKADFLQQGIP
jgi:hypothetical protein